MKCGILHAREDIRKRLAGFVGQTPFLSLTAVHASPADMLAACHRQEVELLFCGIDEDIGPVASFCSLLGNTIRVVFVSTDKSRAFDCFRLNALDFLLTTDPYPVFLASANKALREREATPEKTHIYIKSGFRIIRLEFGCIDYLESCGDYVKVHCNNQAKPILTLCSLKKLEATLPPRDFIRVHRSYIVRKESISVVENGSIVFGKERIPVSKAHLKNLQEYLNICMG